MENKIEALRVDLERLGLEHRDLLERFNALHPPPSVRPKPATPTPTPRTLQEALTGNFPPPSPTITPSTAHPYGIRHTFRMSCKSEYLFEHIMHRFL
jgi:hypothetical protein